jgi:hypothetical protein
MDTSSKQLVWAFAVLGCLSVALTFYKSVIVEDFTIVYCDEEDCYKEMTEEMLGEETEDVAPEEGSPTTESETASTEDSPLNVPNTEDI